MLPRLLGYIIWLPALFGLGSLFLILIRRRIDIPNDEGNLLFLTVGGIAILGTVANIANFVIPTGTIVPIITLIAGWVLFIVNRRAIASWVLPDSRAKIALLTLVYVVSMVVTAYYTQRGLLNIDVGGYHFPAVKWTTNSVLPLGLANINPYFAFNFLWFQAAAMMEVIPTGNYSAFIVNGLLLTIFTTTIWYAIATGLRGRFTPSNIFMALYVLAWGIIVFYSPKEVYSFTPNLPVALLIMLSIFFSLRALDTKTHWPYYLIVNTLLIIVSVAIKVSSLMLVISPLIIGMYWWRADRARFFTTIRPFLTAGLVTGLVIFVPMLVRSVLISGCLFYPLPVSCVVSQPWTRSIDDVKQEYFLLQ